MGRVPRDGHVLSGASEEDRVFLETTRRLAPPSLALADARLALEWLEPSGAVADLGCGYGRHLHALAQLGHRRLVGVDRSAPLLAEAARQLPSAALVRADLRSLPLRTATIAAAACFYSSMFLGSEADAIAALAEAARVLTPSGRLLLTTDNPLRLRASPRARFQEDVAGLGRVSEQSEFDAAAMIDVVRRRVETPHGTWTAEFRIRYFLPDQLARLGAAAGLRAARIAPLHADSPQLTALFTRAG